jgi:hypothetical protein
MSRYSPIRYAAVACLLTASLSAYAQLKLSCGMEWPFSDIANAPPDTIIGGVKASEWTQAHLQLMLNTEEECSRSGPGSESERRARWEDIRDRAYPNAVRSLEARDKKILLEQSAALVRKVQAEAERVAPSAIPNSTASVPAC